MDNKRVVIWQLVRKKLPFFVMSEVVSAATVIAQSSLGIVPTTDELSGVYRIAVCVYSAGGILSVFGRVFLLESVGGMSLWTAESWRKPPYITSARTWYVITLLPVIGLIQVSSQAWADHYAHLVLTRDFCMDCMSECAIGGGGFLEGWRALGWWFFCR